MSEAKFTKGPWRWEINKKGKIIELCGSGIEVLRFKRWGMNSATPTFTIKDDVFKVQGAHPNNLCKSISGREHHADWCQTIDHPDAYLIAAAPEMYELLSNLQPDSVEDEVKIEALLAKARGES